LCLIEDHKREDIVMTETVDDSKNSRETSATARALNAQARASIERQREQSRQQAEQILDKEAISAIEETQRAIDAINANQNREALSALERASGKINVLLARNPATALIPVSQEIVILDTAPEDIDSIVEIADVAEAAMVLDDYPAARALLYGLLSELRLRTYNLPLGTYPGALTETARLLDQKKNEEARIVLMSALSTLVAIDQVTPIPLLLVREAINAAQSRRDDDKESALAFLNAARHELGRAMALGYAGQDPEYKALSDDISNIEKQIKKDRDTSSFFSKLQERLSAFLKRQSEGKQSRLDKSHSKPSDHEKRAA
jgi:hypothetical protein